MGVELVMQVSRAHDDRLSGTLRVSRSAEPRGFSGTLELMRVLEDLVPADRGGPTDSGDEIAGTTRVRS